jgi:hypothetical protein
MQFINSSKATDQDSSLVYDLIDIVYESVLELEEQLKDLFRPDNKKSNSIINQKRASEQMKLDKRKTVVMSNVPHFQKSMLKSKRKKNKGRNNDDNRKSEKANKEKVKIFDEEFDKVFNIMLGINRSIYWLFDSPYYQIDDADYKAKFEYNNQWYSQSGLGVKIFTFTDYAPKIFENIRKLDGIKNEDYANALGPSNIFKYIWSNNMCTFKEL